MKKLIILTLILSTLLLSGCLSDKEYYSQLDKAIVFCNSLNGTFLQPNTFTVKCIIDNRIYFIGYSDEIKSFYLSDK